VWTPPTPPVTQAPPQSTTTQSVNPVLRPTSDIDTHDRATEWQWSGRWHDRMVLSGGTGSGDIGSRLGSGGSPSGTAGLDEFGGAGSRSGVLGDGAGSGAKETGRMAGSVAAEEEALARGTTGAQAHPVRRWPGAVRREQDAEHQRRYTYDEDPDVFDGDLPNTPPPSSAPEPPGTIAHHAAHGDRGGVGADAAHAATRPAPPHPLRRTDLDRRRPHRRHRHVGEFGQVDGDVLDTLSVLAGR